MTSPFFLAVSPILLWVPIAPLLAALLLGLAVFEVVRRTPGGAALLGHPAWPWLIRGALVVLFTMAMVDLIQDTDTLS